MSPKGEAATLWWKTAVRRRLLILIGLALALPAPALAQEATIVSRDVPLGGERTLATAGSPARFDLVGLHWRGAGTVRFRVRSTSGRWSAWEAAAPEAEDVPDAGTVERARAGAWRLGNPWWVGPSDRIEYRVRGRVTRLRAWFVSSPAAGVPARTLQKAGAPAIVPRAGWKADEKIRRAGPSFAANLRIAIVHHTAGANGYTAAQAPAIVRAIQLYHVKGNGWNDIGYNFLVDRFGTVYEGRYGGVERNVVGAHAEGFNTGSVGVAVLGEYSSLAVAAKARSSLAALLAWRLDVAHVDPATTQSFISGGNARFGAGLPVFLRTISGHRDTGFTDCPGTALYNLLNAIGGEVARIGLPKLYAPTVTGAVPGMVRFRAKLSSPLPWTVDVYDASGNAVASSPGTGANVDWTWDARAVLPASYTYMIRSDQSVTPAQGVIGGGDVSLAIAGLSADPETVSPNGDTISDSTTITYTLNTPANVAVRVLDVLGAQVCDLPEDVEARRRARAPLRPGPAPGRDLPDRARRQRDRQARCDRIHATGGDANARKRRGHPARVLAERRRPRRPDLVQVLARCAGRGAACGSRGTASGWRRHSPVRSKRAPGRSTGTASSASAGSWTGCTRRPSRRPTRSRRPRSRCRLRPTRGSRGCGSSSAARSGSGSTSPPS